MNEFLMLLDCIVSTQQWEQWEKEAEELEVTLDYYIMEFL